MVRRRIIAMAMVMIGILQLTTPGNLWTSGTYSVARELTSRPVWGSLFLLLGVVLAVPWIPRWFAVASLAGHLTLWSVCLLIPVITGEAESGTAWVWPGLVAVLTIETAAGDQ